PQPLLIHAVFYAPIDCYSRTTLPGTLPSSEIGVYTNISPGNLDPRNTVLYRAAFELAKLETQRPAHEKRTAH
ncbi:MAG: hypothetical protein ACRD3O_13560, partial [Terriglobia bacterium]